MALVCWAGSRHGQGSRKLLATPGGQSRAGAARREPCQRVPPERGGGRHGHARARAGLGLLRAAFAHEVREPSQWVLCGHDAHQDWRNQRRLGRSDKCDRHTAKTAPSRSTNLLMLLRRTRREHVQRSTSVQHLRSTMRVKHLRTLPSVANMAWERSLARMSETRMWSGAARGWRRARPPRAPFAASELV